MNPIFKFDKVPIPIENHPLYKNGTLPDLTISNVDDAINYTSK